MTDRADIIRKVAGEILAALKNIDLTPKAPAQPQPPKGCICPPGAEITCQRLDCGRKGPQPIHSFKSDTTT